MHQISFKNFIQIAGISDKSEAELLISEGVEFLGFPLRLPVNKEDLTEDEAAEIIASLKPPNYGIVITYSSTAEEALSICKKIGCRIIQLHGDISASELEKIKKRDPEILIIKSLVVKEENENLLINSLNDAKNFVDAYITDTFDPSTGASGATGKTHDWEISKRLRELSPKPLILAGGLNPTNVFEAIMHVRPAGVDVHTGVEDGSGRKDRELLHKFLQEAGKAFNEIRN